MFTTTWVGYAREQLVATEAGERNRDLLRGPAANQVVLDQGLPGFVIVDQQLGAVQRGLVAVGDRLGVVGAQGSAAALAAASLVGFAGLESQRECIDGLPARSASAATRRESMLLQRAAPQRHVADQAGAHRVVEQLLRPWR